jgi:hypothetical protein
MSGALNMPQMLDFLPRKFVWPLWLHAHFDFGPLSFRPPLRFLALSKCVAIHG